jgi:hypothetical protein
MNASAIDESIEASTEEASQETAQADTGVDEEAAFAEQAKAAASKMRIARQAEDAANDNATTTGLAAESPKATPANDNQAEPPAAEESPLKKLLKARAKGQEELGQAQSQAARIKQEAEAWAAEFKNRTKAEVEAMIREAELGGRRKLDELMSPESLAARQADEADPVYKLGKRFESEIAKRDAQIAELLKRDEARDAWIRQREENDNAAKRTYAEKQFVASVSEEKFPYMRALWDEGEILKRAHAVIDDARSAARESGQAFSCTDADVMLFLEEEAKDTFTKRSPSFSKLLGQKHAGSGAGGAPQASIRANGPRTLSTSHASERRASPRPTSELSDEEQVAAMRVAARKRFRA